MALSFSDLKKQSQNKDKLDALIKQFETETTRVEDTRFWKLEVDKAGNGSAVIRFMDQAPNEDVVSVKIYTHEFQGPGGWYIDKCLTTVGQECPVCAANKELWDTGLAENQDIVRKRKRKLRYISNIYVVKDGLHPENEGKVFLFRYGQKIYNMIKKAMKPDFEDEAPKDPFNFWTGCNFRLRQTLVENYPNYDSSKFDETSPLSKNDEVIQKLWESQYSLLPFHEEIKQIDSKKQQERLMKVLKLSGSMTVSSAPSRPASSAGSAQALLNAASTLADNEDLDLDYFRKLAEAD